MHVCMFCLYIKWCKLQVFFSTFQGLYEARKKDLETEHHLRQLCMPYTHSTRTHTCTHTHSKMQFLLLPLLLCTHAS